MAQVEGNNQISRKPYDSVDQLIKDLASADEEKRAKALGSIRFWPKPMLEEDHRPEVSVVPDVTD